MEIIFQGNHLLPRMFHEMGVFVGIKFNWDHNYNHLIKMCGAITQLNLNKVIYMGLRL